jgi:hypothetical protein
VVGASNATQIFVRAWPGARRATINLENEATRAGGLATHSGFGFFGADRMVAASLGMA